MRYILSDIHGCFLTYQNLLQKINFSDADHLYILGDVVDRGEHSIQILQDMMKRNNVTYIIGNHDFLLYYFMKKFGLSLNEYTNAEDMEDFKLYLQDGGLSTVNEYLQLSDDDKESIYKYIGNASAYEVVTNEEKTYILVHANIAGFQEEKPLEDYDVLDFITGRIDYSKRYLKNENYFIVTGHTPTYYIDSEKSSFSNNEPKIYKDNGHIAIDCGCVYGGRLAAYCVETGNVEYE